MYTPGTPYVTGTVISSTVANLVNSDFATGLSNVICKDGQQVPTANLPMGGFKLTGLGLGTASGDSVPYQQVTMPSLAVLGNKLGLTSAANAGWASTYQVLQLNGQGAYYSPNNSVSYITANIYDDGVSQKYIATNTAAAIQVSRGNVLFNTYVSGTAGNTVVFGAQMFMDTNNFTMVSATGGIGYGSGAGGTVTQATSKSTTVTLNKPTGQITLNNAALGAGATVSFRFNNSLLAATDLIIVNVLAAGVVDATNYRVFAGANSSGFCFLTITNTTAGSLSEAVVINFDIFKGANV